MRKAKSSAFLLTLILSLALLIMPFGVLSVSADESTDTQVTAKTNTSVKQGNSGYCYVYIDSLESLSSLSVTVHYDADKIKVQSAYNTVSSLLNDKSVDESSVQFSYIFDGKGQNTKTLLFYFYYTVLSDAEIGETYFDIVVNEAYNSSLQPVSVSGSRCAFSITETVFTKTCYIYSSPWSVSTSVGEEFDLSYSLSTYEIASGSFAINYDPELFEVVSVTNGDFCDGKIVDVNTNLAGSVYVSFVGTKYNYNTNLITVKFRTLKNVAETSTIKMVVTEFYDLALDPISCSGYTTTANIAFDETYTEDAPNMTLQTTYNAVNDKVTLTIKLDKDSMLGAGDFVLKFNSNYLTYISTQKEFSPTFFNINDKNVADGILKFSIISLTNITDEQTVLTVTFDVKHACVDILVGFEISGSGLTDALTNVIVLNFVDAELTVPSTGHNYTSIVTPPTSTTNGVTTYTCSGCGDSYTETLIPVDFTVTSDNRTQIGYTGERDETLVIPAVFQNEGIWYRVTSIGVQAFYNCPSLKSVTIPDSVTSIGEDAFAYSGLSSITIPDSVTNIGNGAFMNCGSLTSITIPNSVTSIGNSAFNWCINLTNITIPAGVTRIGSYAFKDCTNLISINFGDTIEKWNAINKGLNWNSDSGKYTIYCTDGNICKAHTEVVDQTVSPDCTNTGLTEGKHCSVCGVVLVEQEVVDALGHSFTNYVSNNDATCTVDGTKTAKCDNGCGKTDTITDAGSVLGHSHTATVTKPTCMEQGYTTYTCHCGDSYVADYVDALGHSYGDWDETKAPTCTAKGEEKRECSECDHFETREVDKVPHTYVDVVTKPTCTEGGYTTHTCSCGDSYVDEFVNSTGHTYGEWILDMESTCVDSGSRHKTCTFCENVVTETLGLDMTKHTTTGGFCYRCKCVVIEMGVYYERIDVGITSAGGSGGIKEYLSSYAVADSDTITIGEESDFFYGYKLYIKGNAVGVYNVTVYGKHLFGSYEEALKIKVYVIEHNHDEQPMNAVAPTCGSAGLTEGVRCSECKEVLVEQQTVPKLPHTEVEDAGKEATCTESGLTKGSHCSVCNEIIVAQETILATGHHEVTKEGKEATCTETGLTEEVSCSVCNEILAKQEIIAAKGHSYISTVTSPTCTEQGYTTNTCECGDSYVDTYTSAAGHSYGEWFVTKTPTCTAVGEEKRECSACDHFETRLIDKKVHIYVDTVIPPTCTERGYTAHKCACGDGYVGTYTQALGHSFGDWYTTIKPTETEKGEEKRECSACDHFETRALAAIKDTYDNKLTTDEAIILEYEAKKDFNFVLSDESVAKIINMSKNTVSWGSSIRVVSSVTIQPLKPGYVVVQVVDETGVILAESVLLIVEGTHQLQFAEVITPATCTEKGTEIYCCKFCEYEEQRVIDALGHIEVVDTYVDPTCTETGLTEGKHCSRCNTVLVAQEVISATGHSYGDWFVTVKPTCTATGEEKRACSDCDHFETRVVNKIAHTYIPTVTKPTCTEGGYTTYTCKCGDSYIDTHTEALGHSFTNYVSDGNATFETDGTKTAVCDNGCGAKDTVTDVGSKLEFNDITSAVYEVKDNLISGISIKTTVKELKEAVNETSYVRVVKDGKVVGDNTALATGMKLQLVIGNKVVKEVTVVVTGDTNGDGNISVTDMISVKAHILKKSTLSGAYAKAGDTNGDGTISITDFIQIKAHILGKSSLEKKSVKTYSAVIYNAATTKADEKVEPEPVSENVCYVCMADFLVPTKFRLFTGTEAIKRSF